MKDRNLLGRDIADDPNAEARPGERLAPHDLVRQAQFGSNRPHLIFKKQSERLDQFELNVVWQPTDVVVALDLRCVTRTRLDDVGIERSLHQILRTHDLGLGSFEYTNELLADRLALGFGVDNPVEVLEEAVGRADVNEFDALGSLERLDDLVGFALSHQAGVDIDTGETIADSLMHKRSGNSRVDAT